MNKKAQGISLNVIIIAAIALIVLVVLIAIFTGRLSGFQSELGEISDAEVFRVQAMSTSRCVPSKQGIVDIKGSLVGESELQANQQYNEQIQETITNCGRFVQSVRTEDDNRQACNSATRCVWR
ncbi:MAG: hypothetical protein U9R08_05475 [Nanoarchaeota archaeon]|nr:hypothetical protein [Nanoarchaeota archaeon]